MAFLGEQVSDALQAGVLFSLHMKATMMKVSDPIIFGHAVRVFFADVFSKHAATLDELGANPNHGFAEILERIETLPGEERTAIEADIQAAYAERPRLGDGQLRQGHHESPRSERHHHRRLDARHDSHVRPDVERGRKPARHQGGHPRQQLRPRVSRSHRFLSGARRLRSDHHGQRLQRRTDGAEGRRVRVTRQDLRDRPADGVVRVVDASGAVLIEHEVGAQATFGAAAKRRTLRSETGLGLQCAARAPQGHPRCFGSTRRGRTTLQLIAKVNAYLPEHDTDGLEIHIMAPAQATRFSLERIKDGKDTISVTGNVLRDYLTDLFPILEVGTSAKMLSIVPLMNGGGLFETGAGGSAPKHVQQFQKENHLRWDSLGEFLALAASLDYLAERGEQPQDESPRRLPRRSSDKVPPREQVPFTEGQRNRQPREPFLPGALLGTGACRVR